MLAGVLVVPEPEPTPVVVPAPDVVEEPRLEIYAHRALQFEQAVAELSPPVEQFVGVPTWLAVTSERAYAPITANAGPLWATQICFCSHSDIQSCC